MNVHVAAGGFPALVLNADFRPLSYYPLSLWSWQDAIKAVFLERVNIVALYDKAWAQLAAVATNAMAVLPDEVSFAQAAPSPAVKHASIAFSSGAP